MRKSKVLAKLRSGSFARICGMGHFLPFFIRYAAHYKYDGIWFDLEHRAMNDREVQTVLALCNFYDIDCMVRPPTLERSRLYRYLEDGASGFMIPFCSTAEIARHVVNSVKFPPLGNRGIDGAGVDGDFGLVTWAPGSTYTTDANRETFILGQIETPEALANAEEIAAVPGIDALFIGPADLRLRLESAPGPKVEFSQVVEQVAAAARRNHITWGLPMPTLEEIKQYRKMGAQIVTYGSDFFLFKVLENCSKELDTIS